MLLHGAKKRISERNLNHPEQWLVHEHEEEGVVGFAYFRPEPLAEGTWNLLAIGLRKAYQLGLAEPCTTDASKPALTTSLCFFLP